MNQIQSGLCFALGLLALSAPPAHGQVPDRQSRSIEEIQVTATRQAKSVAEVAGGVTVLGAGELEAAAPQVLPESLKGQTGAWVQQTTPGQAAVIVRGLKGSEILHLVDGMRLNNAFFRNAPSQYLALVDGQIVERVEVLRGPASSLYGSDAMGGVVQIISASPRFDGGDWASRTHLLGRYSSAHAASLVRADFETGRRGLGIAGGMTYQGVGRRRAGDGSRLAFSDWSSRSANLAVLAAPADRHEFSLSLQYLEQPRSYRHDELVAGFGQDEPASAVFNFEPNDRLFLHGRYRSDEKLGFLDTLELNMAWQEINDDRRTRDTGSREERREANRSGLLGIMAQGGTSLGNGHELVYGIERYSDEVRSSRLATNIDTGATSVVASRFPDGSTMDSLAIYLADQWQFNDRTALGIGARYSRFETELPAADRSVGARVSAEDLTGNLSLNYEFGPGLHVVMNAGRGFRSPNIFDLGTLGPRPGNRFNIGNPDLGAETVLTADMGIKLERGALRGEFFLWASEYRDKIVSVPTGETTLEGRDIVRSENLNKVKLRGAEAGFKYLGEPFEAYGGVTATWGEEQSPDGRRTPADRIPPVNGRLGVAWQAIGRLRVEPYLAFARSQGRLSDRDIRDPRINPAGTAGWMTANLRLGWELGPTWRASLNLLNLGDIGYREHGSGVDAAGLDAVLSVRARFGAD